MFDLSGAEWWQAAAVAVASVFVFALLVRVLWNATVPAMFGGRTIGFWQAVLLLLLTGVLFRGPVFTYSWSVEERQQQGLAVTVGGQRNESSGSTSNRRGFSLGFP